MAKCKCADCPHDTVSTKEKLRIGLLVGSLVMLPNVVSALKNVLADSLQPAALALAAGSMQPFVLVLLLSLYVLVRMASANPLETALTAAGLPAALSSLLKLGQVAAQ